MKQKKDDVSESGYFFYFSKTCQHISTSCFLGA